MIDRMKLENMNDLRSTPNFVLARKLYWLNGILTVAVLMTVGLMRQIKIPLPPEISFSFLPPFYSSLNAFAAVLLIVGYFAIKRGNVVLHRRAVNGAMVCSFVFLLGYVLYHFTSEETRFGGTGWIRSVYLTLLVSHIVLAALSLPFILLTWTFATTGQFARHRKLAKIVFPVWLYVALTGPVCYLMLRPYY
jgi:putative membrane protein